MSGILSTAVLLVLGLLGGASLVVQASLSAGLRERLQSVSWAGLVSYLGGTLAMLVTVALVRPPLTFAQVRAIPFSWWLGGLFGAAYLGAAILILPRLGVATVFALVVTGQLLCSLLFDHYGLFGVPVHALDVRRALGAVLLVSGVALIRF
jgi:transporter family-2 protein